MPSTQEVIAQNNQATDYVVGTPGQIDNTTAELVLRNTAVVTDRLTPKQFSELGTGTVDAVLDAAAVAKDIAPLSDTDQQKLPTETRPEHEYRTQIWGPLHNLQSAVSLGEFDSGDPATVASVKKAVWLGSKAFQEVVSDPNVSELREVQSTIGYFGGNSRAAAGRAEHLASRT